jgi:phosphoribosyl-ATP pyrophosphohydrolase/phosphoribosyl-AMP cyclohydrolase
MQQHPPAVRMDTLRVLDPDPVTADEVLSMPDRLLVMPQEALDRIRFDDRGLIVAVAQDCRNGRILMLAWMNAEALGATLASGYATYWSRSRNRLWRKGEESGNLQKVRSIRLDCDGDALVLQVDQAGVACHTGRMSCFFHRWQNGGWRVIEDPLSDEGVAQSRWAAEAPPEEGTSAELSDLNTKPGQVTPEVGYPATVSDSLTRLAGVIRARRDADPQRSYVARLLMRGEDTILKKVGEEATECVLAAKDGSRERIVAECADLWFHCLVMLEHYGLAPADVVRELERREGISGLDEKAVRKAIDAEVVPAVDRKACSDKGDTPR